MPIPPARAMAMARLASVTVSMAAERIGTWSSMPGVTSDAVDTSFGNTSLAAGTRSTSSKVSPSLANRSEGDWAMGALGSGGFVAAGYRAHAPIAKPIERSGGAAQRRMDFKIARATVVFIWYAAVFDAS